jgi:hypothetical protein
MLAYSLTEGEGGRTCPPGTDGGRGVETAQNEPVSEQVVVEPVAEPAPMSTELFRAHLAGFQEGFKAEFKTCPETLSDTLQIQALVDDHLVERVVDILGPRIAAKTPQDPLRTSGRLHRARTAGPRRWRRSRSSFRRSSHWPAPPGSGWRTTGPLLWVQVATKATMIDIFIMARRC